MAAHFLLSPLCRTLSVAEVARMSEDEAWRAFCRIRWAATGGDPVCPRCQGLVHYVRLARRKWICKSCGYEFSVTAGTILADRKMSFGDLLLAIFLFVNAVKGLPALQLSREIGCDYKAAFVLLHKLRECLEAEQARHLWAVREPSARLTPPTSAAMASRPTITRTAAICGWRRTGPASASALSWCANATAGQRQPSSRARRRLRPSSGARSRAAA